MCCQKNRQITYISDPSETYSYAMYSLINYNMKNAETQPLFKTGNPHRRVKQICPYVDWLPIGHTTSATALDIVELCFHARGMRSLRAKVHRVKWQSG